MGHFRHIFLNTLEREVWGQKWWYPTLENWLNPSLIQNLWIPPFLLLPPLLCTHPHPSTGLYFDNDCYPKQGPANPNCVWIAAGQSCSQYSPIIACVSVWPPFRLLLFSFSSSLTKTQLLCFVSAISTAKLIILSNTFSNNVGSGRKFFEETLIKNINIMYIALEVCLI